MKATVATVTVATFAIAASLTPGVLALVQPRSPYVVKGSHPVPPRWERVDRADPDHSIELRIGLTQSDFEELERQLYEKSDPGHSKFGQHLSADAVHDLVKPSAEALDLVHEWLQDHGIESGDLSYSKAKDWIKVKLPVAKVEELLDTEYHSYVRDDGLHAVRTPEWSVPLHLHEHISTIQPTNSFFGPRRSAPIDRRDSLAIADGAIDAAKFASLPGAGSVDEVCDVDLVTPTCVRTLYGTINYTVQAADKNTVALNNFLGEVNLRSDARLDLLAYRPEAVSGADTFTQISIAGGTVQQTPLNETQVEDGTGLEGNLDVQTILGVAWPTPLTVYSTGGSPPFVSDAFTTSNTNEPYLVWLDYLLSLPDPLPSVVSTSYDDDEQTVPKDYAVSVCNALAQLGSRGVSVLFASGDNGIGADGYCVSNDGTNSSTFLPNFPSTCPFVTSVGGTFKTNPEVAVFRHRPGRAIYTAGGGFSYYFARPKYQDQAVPPYVKNVLDPLGYDGLYDPNGRAYPDIAAQALNYSVYWNGQLTPVSGTSMSTPIASAILALVNDALIAAGKSTLGFLNPWLYAGGYRAFNDIVSGYAAGCNTTEGFPAAEGWDAVTGHGTPNFAEILALKGVGSNGGWGNWSGW
ncbi:hypothetical protein DV737_g663, partial [Chaetothyriales sp. CBS 132003]